MILALAGQFKQLSHEPEKFCIAEVMGSNPVESPEFFRFMRQLLKLSSKCEDHIFTEELCLPYMVRHTFWEFMTVTSEGFILMER